MMGGAESMVGDTGGERERERATSNSLEQALNYKQRGNGYFKEGKYKEAIHQYTDAIDLYNEDSTFWTNRALCHSKLEDWENCIYDCRKALNCDEESVKAYFYLAKGLTYIPEYDEALAKIVKACTLMERKTVIENKKLYKEIRQLRSQIEFERWQSEEDRRLDALEDLSIFVNEELQKATFMVVMSECATEEKDVGHLDKVHKLTELLKLIGSNKKRMGDREIPEALKCPISMGLMREPVTTPSGVTYEKQFLETYFMTKKMNESQEGTDAGKNNKVLDPVSRKDINMNDLYPNLSIKEVTKEFVEKKPWAIQEYGLTWEDWNV